MKRAFAATALVFTVVTAFAAMPMLGHAVGPVTGSCTKPSPSPYPKPQPDAQKTTMPTQVDPKGVVWAWKDGGNTKAQVGTTSTGGWITADVDSTNRKASVKGYSYRSQQGYGNVNGQLDVSQSNTAACYGVNNQKVNSPVVGSGTCTTNSPRPKPPAGSNVQSFAPADASGAGWAWKDAGNTKAQLGANGGHGYIVGTVDSTAKSATVKGFSTDTGNVNGYADISQSKQNLCLGANNQKITIS